jgi:hypothetical protein
MQQQHEMDFVFVYGPTYHSRTGEFLRELEKVFCDSPYPVVVGEISTSFAPHEIKGMGISTGPGCAGSMMPLMICPYARSIG